jgi:hypothetical protein
MRARFISRAGLVGSIFAALTAACALGQGQQPVTLTAASGATGSESVLVSGKSLAYADVSLTASALISRDLPVIGLGTKTVRAGADGTFHTTIDLAPLYQRGILITVVAATAGAQPVSATTAVDAPNATIFNPAWDDTEGSF